MPHAAPSVADMTHALKGINFPADKKELKKQAQNNQAPDDVISAIEHLPEDKFSTMADVARAYGEEDTSQIFGGEEEKAAGAAREGGGRSQRRHKMAERQSERQGERQLPFGPEQFFRTTQQFFGVTPMLSMTSPPLRQIWVANDKILDEFEELAHNWVERRHEANRTALEATKAISENRGSDVTDAVRIMSDWLTKSMERISEDAKDNYEFCVKCASHMAGGGVAATEELAESTSEQARRAASEGSRMMQRGAEEGGRMAQRAASESEEAAEQARRGATRKTS